MSRPPRALLPRLVAIGAAAAVLVSAVLFAKVVPLGIPFEWTWPYWPPGMPRHWSPLLLAPPVALALLLIGALRASDRRPFRWWGAALILSAVAGLHAALLIAAVPGFSPKETVMSAPVRMGQLIASPVSFGYYMAALDADDAATLLRTHERTMADPEAPERVRTHPPGPALAYLAINSVFDSLHYPATRAFERVSGVDQAPADDLRRVIQGPIELGIGPHEAVGAVFAGYVTALLGALVVIPVFLLGHEMGGWRVGLATACLYAVTPSPIVFVPSIDAWVAILAVTCLWLIIIVARRGSLSLAAAAGLPLWAALQVSFGAIALVPIVGIVLLLAGRFPWRKAALLFAVFLGVAVVLSMLMWALTSYNAFHAFVLSRAAHADVTARRTYLPWIGGDLLDFAFGFGVCATVCLVAAGREALANLRASLRDAASRPATALLVAALATLLLLDLSGTVRGEVARIWQFLMPLLLAPTVAWLHRFSQRFAATMVVVLACQFLQAFAMDATVAFMVPW